MIKQEWPNDMCPRCGRPWSTCQCKYKPKRNGFSFVEVIIVIAILIIVCSLLYPAVVAIKDVNKSKNINTIQFENYATKSLDINTDIGTIIIDNEKYIIARSGTGISICPAISKNIQNIKVEKAEKEN